MNTLRKPFFIAALILSALVVLIELTASVIVRPDGASAEMATPGQGIRALAFVDGLLLYQLLLMGISLVMNARLYSRIQGIGSLILAILMLLSGIFALVVSFALLILMITLLMAVPFGTIAYFAAFADFPYGSATITLSTLMTLKMFMVICLLAANLRFLTMKGLMLLVITSLAANFLVHFLHALVPGFLMSITDGVGALIAIVLGLIWAIVLLVYAIPSILKALRVDRAVA